MKKPIYVVAGARPNFMKIAPLIQEFQKEEIISNKYTQRKHIKKWTVKIRKE